MTELRIFPGHILCSCTMKNDLLLFGFDHAVRFDVIIMLVFFNNLRLKHGCLCQFENNQVYLVAIRPNSSKNTKSFGNYRVFTLSVAAFLC